MPRQRSVWWVPSVLHLWDLSCSHHQVLDRKYRLERTLHSKQQFREWHIDPPLSWVPLLCGSLWKTAKNLDEDSKNSHTSPWTRMCRNLVGDFDTHHHWFCTDRYPTTQSQRCSKTHCKVFPHHKSRTNILNVPMPSSPLSSPQWLDLKMLPRRTALTVRFRLGQWFRTCVWVFFSVSFYGVA